MSTKTRTDVDRCDLCNHRLDGGYLQRLSHIRRSHPRYARGLLLRLCAPFAFLALVLVMGALHAPQNAFLVAFAITFGMLFFGKQISRSARTEAGARRTLPIRQLAREGGLAIVLLIPIVVLIMIGLSKLR